jgi:hypothetical protein
MSRNNLERQIAIRLSEEDVSRLDSLSETLSILSRNAIARAAMRIGLARLEEDPRRIAEVPPAPKRGGARTGAGRKKHR